jgi:hypothetical protein
MRDLGYYQAMHWILQNNLFKEEAFIRLIETLERFNIPYSEHKVVPFVGTLIPVGFDGSIEDVSEYDDPALLALKGPVICMGSYSMRHAAIRYGWTPGVFDLMEAGSFDRCMEHWGHVMLNADSVVIPFGHAAWPAGEERFIRPTDDSKYFAGKTIEADEFRDWQRNVCVLKLDYGNSLRAETMIQVAKLKKIYAEYRCWVVKGRIITMSLYKRGDTVMYQNMDGDLGAEARNFANTVLRSHHGGMDIRMIASNVFGWHPAEAFCLDVCETDEGWKVVEVNTINACGFYAANLTSLVLALEGAFNGR